ncbi:hypothetical protein ACS3QZ_06625 [Shimia sp. W99]
MSGWPVFRTDKEAARKVFWRHHAIACAAVLIVPSLLGYIYLILFISSETKATLSWGGVDGLTISLFASFAAFSFYFSWIGLLMGVPLAIAALKRGIAGWGMALLAGAAVGQVVALVLSMPIALAMGPFLALIYWISLRLSVPGAFVG